jgi:CheY-like chemotaxis protein
MPENRPIRILHVEDTEADADMTALALKEGNIPHMLHVVTDGAQAVDYLMRKPPYKEAARPDLILLDLDLPRLRGEEVLELIKNHESLRAIPIIIFSTYNTNKSKHNAYKLHANSYVVKPNDTKTFMEKVQAIAHYWSNVSELPVVMAD